jgi:5'(3')-deoxyribonucleotidase
MKQLTILTDMDDTIEDLTPPWVEYINRKHGTPVTPEDITGWTMSDHFPTLTEEEVYAPLLTDELWKEVKPKPGALGYLLKLKEDGHKLYIVTSCPFGSVNPKMRWVFYGYLSTIFDWKDVVITSQKHLVKGDVLIDDGLHNHTARRPLSILMDAPHNRGFKCNRKRMVRAKTWEDVYSAVCEFATRRRNQNTPNSPGSFPSWKKITEAKYDRYYPIHNGVPEVQYP